MAITKNVTYTCSDGKEFVDENLAEQHEHEITVKSASRYKEWINVSYNGRKLLEKHTLSEYGMWHIRGEDPNCDLGGHHYQPDLGTFEGYLEDVIKHAVKIPNFYTWGSGGDITKVKIRKL